MIHIKIFNAPQLHSTRTIVRNRIPKQERNNVQLLPTFYVMAKKHRQKTSLLSNIYTHTHTHEKTNCWAHYIINYITNKQNIFYFYSWWHAWTIALPVSAEQANDWIASINVFEIQIPKSNNNNRKRKTTKMICYLDLIENNPMSTHPYVCVVAPTITCHSQRCSM